MIHRLAWRIAVCCLDGDGDVEIVAYGLECRISDMVQIAALILAGLLFRCMAAVVAFSLCFTVLKRNVGGYHCTTHAACIGGFTAAAVLLSGLAIRVPSRLAVIISIAGMAVALGLVVRRAPIAHTNHPKSTAAHARSRAASLRLAAVGTALLPLIARHFPAIGVAGSLGGLAAAATLAIPIKAERRE